MAYSLDLRQKVLAALETESSSEVVAERFGISASFERKLRVRVKQSGDPVANIATWQAENCRLRGRGHSANSCGEKA
jgi:hypothetical protein